MGRLVCHLCVYLFYVSLLLVPVCLWNIPHLHFCISLSQRRQKITILLLLHSLFALVLMSLNSLLNSNMLLQITLATAEILCFLSNTTFVIERFGKSKTKKNFLRPLGQCIIQYLLQNSIICDYKRIEWRKKFFLSVRADKER